MKKEKCVPIEMRLLKSALLLNSIEVGEGFVDERVREAYEERFKMELHMYCVKVYCAVFQDRKPPPFRPCLFRNNAKLIRLIERVVESSLLLYDVRDNSEEVCREVYEFTSLLIHCTTYVLDDRILSVLYPTLCMDVVRIVREFSSISLTPEETRNS